MTKPTKWSVSPVKTQISLGIRPVCSESSLSAWRKLGSLATHWAHSEDSDQTGQIPGSQLDFSKFSIFNNFLVYSPIGINFAPNNLILETLHGSTDSDPFPLRD